MFCGLAGTGGREGTRGVRGTVGAYGLIEDILEEFPGIILWKRQWKALGGEVRGAVAPGRWK